MTEPCTAGNGQPCECVKCNATKYALGQKLAQVKTPEQEWYAEFMRRLTDIEGKVMSAVKPEQFGLIVEIMTARAALVEQGRKILKGLHNG